MDGRLPLPLVLDGAAATNLVMEGMPPFGCHEEWMMEHPQKVRTLYQRFVEAGADMLYTPTHTANLSQLTRFGQEDKLKEYNLFLGKLTREVAGDRLVAGCVAPYPFMEPEPVGETAFLDIVTAYAEQAFALKEAGVDLFVADTMISIAQCRAAILGCRQTGLPVMVTMTVDEDGETTLGCQLESALVVCQALGAVAFGISCNSPESMLEQIEVLAEFSSIPILVKPDAKDSLGAMLSPQEMGQEMEKLLRKGAKMIGGCCGTTPEHIAVMRQLLDSWKPLPMPQKNDTYDFLLASDLEAFFLSETFELSEDIFCGLDMSDHLLEIEESGADVASIIIDTVDDAVQFAQNAHMLRMPVCFLCDNEEALEMALLLYNGKAMVNAQSQLDESILARIAGGYGAIIR